MAPVTVFALGKMVARAIFATELMHSKVGCSRTQFFHLLPDGLTLAGTREIEGLQSLLVFFFGELFIENAVLLLVQPHASETIAASKTIFAKLAFPAVRTILAVISHITVRTVNALHAPFAPDAKRETAATDALSRIASIVDIFRVEDPETIVTILRAHRFRILTVLGPILNESVPRL